MPSRYTVDRNGIPQLDAEILEYVSLGCVQLQHVTNDVFWHYYVKYFDSFSISTKFDIHIIILYYYHAVVESVSQSVP